MDPVTQGALGAAFAQAQASPTKIVAATWFGVAAGMAPDLDVLIQSPTDPLLFLEYHRQFTHSLAFIPVGALIVAGALFRLPWHTLSWREAYLACLFGYASHGLLDACTSYGTMLWWPFSDYRVAWDIISIVDPLFTLPIIALLIAAARRRKRWLTFAALGWGATYLVLGTVQHHRALAAADQIADAAGHVPQELTAKPAFGSLLLWKIIYQNDGVYHVHGVRVGTDIRSCGSDQIAKLSTSRDLDFLDAASQQGSDLERFRWFSGDYLAMAQHQRHTVIDLRYSMLPHEIAMMWGIVLSPDAGAADHVEWQTARDLSADRPATLWRQLRGDACTPMRHEGRVQAKASGNQIGLFGTIFAGLSD